MNWVALRILTGDRAKYLGLIFAIAFSTFLIAQQSSLFVVVINRTRSFIVDVTDADIWVMAPATRYLDEVFSLKDNDVDRVRSVPGVRWALSTKARRESLRPTANSARRLYLASTTPLLPALPSRGGWF